MRTCKKCGGTYADVFFRVAQRRYANHGERKAYVCIGCELTARTERKVENRPREKARKALDRHANVFVKRGIIKSRDELASVYGWNVSQMTHDIQHAFENGCPYCHRLFADMPHGLADVTLDIINPAMAPYYRTNTRWVCPTCNSEKQATPPDQWGEKLQMWERWRQVQANPWAALPLFVGLKDEPQMRLL